MAKKRIREWRPDRRRNRKRVPPPTTGWPRAELARLLKLAPGTIGKYIKAGMLPGVEFRGTATRYQRVHLLRLLAVRYLRSQGYAETRRIKAVMDRWTSEQLETWVLSHRHTPAIAAALQASDPNQVAAGGAAVGSDAGEANGATHVSVNQAALSSNQQTPGGIAPASAAAVTNPASADRAPALGGAAQVNGQQLASDRAVPGAMQLVSAMLHAETWQQIHVGAGVMVAWRTDADPAAKELVKRLIAAV